MTNELQSKVIEDNPIGNGLDAFRGSFDSICEGAGIPCSPDALDKLGQDGNVWLLNILFRVDLV